MARIPEKAYTLEVSAIAAAGLQVVIAAQTYYRLRFADLAPIPVGSWGQIHWSPLQAWWPVTAAGVIAASVGAGVALAPARMALWPVDAGSTDLTPGVIGAAVNSPFLLYPGETVDLGDWPGDLIYAEGTDPAVVRATGFDWTAGPFAAALGAAFTIVLDRGAGYVTA